VASSRELKARLVLAWQIIAYDAKKLAVVRPPSGSAWARDLLAARTSSHQLVPRSGNSRCRWQRRQAPRPFPASAPPGLATRSIRQQSVQSSQCCAVCRQTSRDCRKYHKPALRVHTHARTRRRGRTNAFLHASIRVLSRKRARNIEARHSPSASKCECGRAACLCGHCPRREALRQATRGMP
jgi:hypothetical protein